MNLTGIGTTVEKDPQANLKASFNDLIGGRLASTKTSLWLTITGSISFTRHLKICFI